MIGYYLAISMGWLISFLPFRLLYLLSDGLAWLMEYVFHYRQKVINANLKRTFPQRDDQWIQKTRRAFYRNLSDIIVESFKSLSISASTMRKHYRLKNRKVFEKIYAANKGLIMVMGHYTNFEWTAMAVPLLVPQNCFAVYAPLKNPRFNKRIVAIREKFGLKLFRMKETYPFMLNNPDPKPLYVFMADQSPHKQKVRYRASFLDQATPVHLGVENLAKKCDLAVVFIKVRRIKRGYYEMEAKELFREVGKTEQYEVTDRHVAALEELILEDPAPWLWSHKRWKHA
jgi:KDO2-lipid IV(A) lauroyltransferase